MLATGKTYQVPHRPQARGEPQPRNKSAYLASSMPRGYATGGARSNASSHGGTRRHLYSNSASSCSLIYDPQKMLTSKAPIRDQAGDSRNA